ATRVVSNEDAVTKKKTPPKKKPKGHAGKAKAKPAKAVAKKPDKAKKPEPPKKAKGKPAKTRPHQQVKTDYGDEEFIKKPKKIKPGAALVVVESPAKARTINKSLGANYIVKASVGHVRDLPKKVKKGDIGVDLDEGTFEPVYEVIEGKKKVLGEIRKA